MQMSCSQMFGAQGAGGGAPGLGWACGCGHIQRLRPGLLGVR